ncbi:GIY-YIG nuclease family protein [Candidatus Halobonum tyrrellensis]|uniref:GIY-YIG nuclease family protein n=1 Tax=Candidatus Halobonum tyrrellensis TaxID=1431545 RepID=UPI0009B5A298|nr:GIY-YIG nuclease family protein [Candidatus Halobonum tyrrellensis]
MHYCVDGSPTLSLFTRDPFSDRVDDIAERVPLDSYQDPDVRAPFSQDSSIWTIIGECFPYCTAEPRKDAVYVLECFKNESYRTTALQYLGKTMGQPWNGRVEGANRILYVGMTLNLVRRLHRHLNSPGNKGAHFTAVFRPVRLLDVSWWSSFEGAKRAEKTIARRLRDRFPEDYVFQS